MKLWNFKDEKGGNVITEWGRQQTTRDQAKLDQKFDRLMQIDFVLAHGTKLLVGPIEKQKHIYKMKITGDVQLRPMLCRGPADKDNEYTLLVGAIEKGSKLIPGAGQAEKRRMVLLNDPKRRCVHVRIKERGTN
jgi:hypothetical protein